MVEQDLNSLSVEIFAEQHTQRKQVKKLGLKRMVQRLGKQNSLIASLRETSVSLAALTSYESVERRRGAGGFHLRKAAFSDLNCWTH